MFRELIFITLICGALASFATGHMTDVIKTYMHSEIVTISD